MYGRTNAHEVLWRASGAIERGDDHERGRCDPTGRKRAATMALATTPAALRVWARVLTNLPARGGPTVES